MCFHFCLNALIIQNKMSKQFSFKNPDLFQLINLIIINILTIQPQQAGIRGQCPLFLLFDQN